MSDQSLLIISQVYVPDPASVGQHLHDAAAAMARRGWRVRVLTSARGYDDPAIRYPAREKRDGVEIRRFGWSSFGKSSIAWRLAAAASFLAQTTVAGIFGSKPDAILVTTVPPMGSLSALLVAAVRRAQLRFSAMDINPDQAVALGKFQARSASVRMLDALNRAVLRRALAVIALDRFMADRLLAKAPVLEKLAVLPPWPHVDEIDQPLPHEQNPFRREHGLEDKLVLMYSGNLSMAHPITTFLEAAERLRDESRVVFLFVGGGLGRDEVRRFIERGRGHVRLIGYQPIERLRESLSAADVHLVSMGNEMVGIVHPCKVYGAMAVGRPVLLLGPRHSHIGDILARHDVGWQVDHGDVDALVRTIRAILDTKDGALERKGLTAQQVVRDEFSRAALRERFCDVLEGRNIAKLY